jgi:hypothetical protein
LPKLSLSRLEAVADAGLEAVEDAGVEAVVEAVEGARSAAVVAEGQAVWVEWEEADAGVDSAAGLQCREEAIAQGEARPGTCRDPAATARVVWLQTRISPAETSTDPKLLPRSNLVRKAPGPPCLLWLREIGRGPAQGPTKGFQILRTKPAAANSRGELKELGAASSVRWRGGQWRVPVSQILVEAIWGVEAILGAEAIWGAEAILGIEAIWAVEAILEAEAIFHPSEIKQSPIASNIGINGLATIKESLPTSARTAAKTGAISTISGKTKM